MSKFEGQPKAGLIRAVVVALFAEGKEVHCATEMTPSLAHRGRFDPTIDRVLCFDTITEADREFERMHPSIPRRDRASK